MLVSHRTVLYWKLSGLILEGVLIIWSKLSDVFGRKLMATSSVLIFLVFSGACGAAQSITQLRVILLDLCYPQTVDLFRIVFRALQGIGGSGIYAICTVIFFELVPPEKFASYTSLVSVVFVLSLLLGPILGGVINNSSHWRWIFLLK